MKLGDRAVARRVEEDDRAVVLEDRLVQADPVLEVADRALEVVVVEPEEVPVVLVPGVLLAQFGQLATLVRERRHDVHRVRVGAVGEGDAREVAHDRRVGHGEDRGVVGGEAREQLARVGPALVPDLGGAAGRGHERAGEGPQRARRSGAERQSRLQRRGDTGMVDDEAAQLGGRHRRPGRKVAAHRPQREEQSRQLLALQPGRLDEPGTEPLVAGLSDQRRRVPAALGHGDDGRAVAVLVEQEGDRGEVAHHRQLLVQPGGLLAQWRQARERHGRRRHGEAGLGVDGLGQPPHLPARGQQQGVIQFDPHASPRWSVSGQSMSAARPRQPRLDGPGGPRAPPLRWRR